MRKAAAVVFAALTFCLLVVAPALAGSEVPPPDGTQVKGEIVHAGGTAFTGANISLGIVIMVALLLVSVALFAISRRRATAGR
jgi:Zn-dependent protease with chaperone function